MNEISALVADDEKNIRNFIRNALLRLWPELSVCGEAADGDTALAMIQEMNPDIVFLDIRMPGLSGIHVAEKIAGLCRIVFITAHDHYAVQAFENEAVDYVLKPLTEERLKKTIARLQKQMQQSLPDRDQMLALFQQILPLSVPRESGYLSWIKAQCKEGLRLIPTDTIYYFSKKDPYTEVVTRNETFLISKSIKELVSELDPKHFWQIHRATIVNARFIKDVGRSLTGRGTIRLKDRHEILTVSRNYLHVFKQM
jgi:DNA-binding LytR/AlgR family response regulator